jgi:hypothetical protein
MSPNFFAFNDNISYRKIKKVGVGGAESGEHKKCRTSASLLDRNSCTEKCIVSRSIVVNGKLTSNHFSGCI